MRKSKYKMTICKSRSGLYWRWVLYSPNGVAIAESMVDGGYSSRAAAKRAVDIVRYARNPALTSNRRMR